MKKLLITQSNYIPWRGQFDSINMVDEFIIYDDMQYTRRDWRNRNRIKTANGAIWLTIPVEVKGKYHQKINETRVSDNSWRKQHWISIMHSYSKAPFFKHYKDVLEDAYLNSSLELLSEINYHFIKTINKILGITTEVRWSCDFPLADGKTERLVDLCKQCGATDYYSGPAAKNYIDESLFKSENINVHYFDYSGYEEYPQLYGPFVPDVSVIDLIFNTGPDAHRYMKSFRKESQTQKL
jgi:hypothetical protein